MTRMTAHHRAAIFHHAKRVDGSDEVDYVDWLQLFAPTHLQQREMSRRQPQTLRSTTTKGLVPGQGLGGAPMGDNSASQLIEVSPNCLNPTLKLNFMYPNPSNLH